MQQRKLILTLVSACFSLAAAAADRPVIGPIPGWVQPAPAEIVPATGSAAAVQVLLNDQQVRLTPEAVDLYFDNRILIQTPQGLQAVGTIAIAWQPDADVVTVHRLVVRRGGEIRDLMAGKADSFTILRREDLLAQATLTGTLTAILQPSDLQVGDIVEFAYTRRHADPVVPDKPDLQFAWPNAPVQNVRFRAQWPGQMAVHWNLRDFKPVLQESSSGGMQSIAFTLDNPPPLLQPTGAPARFTALRRIQFTTFQSWQEVSQRLGPLYAQASRIAADSPLRPEIERIRSASADPKLRATGALRLVQDQIRYVLLAMNTGALLPATADQTWQRRYGDCKAKTALLLALLHELGIDADAVAVSSAMGDGIDQLLPAINAFDHVLVRARIAGKAYWLDGTRLGDRNLDLLQVPGYRWGLPLTASGSALVSIEPTVLNEPLVAQEVDIDASAGIDAPAPFRGSVVFRGDGATTLRFSLDNLDVTQRDQLLRNQWRNKFSDLQVSKVNSSFDEPGGTLTLTAEGTLRMKWIETDFFEIEDMRLGFDADFTRPENTNMDAPFAVAFPDYSVYRATVKLPAGQTGFGISGEDLDQELAGWEYKRKASIENGYFRAESSSRSMVSEVPAKEARAAEAGLRKMHDSVLYLTKPRRLATAAELRSQAGKQLASAGEYIERGYDMMRRSLYELAIAEFTSATVLEPKNALAWGNRGMSHLELRQLDEARSDLRKALELDPEIAIARRGLGALALEEGRATDAIDLLGKSLAGEESNWARERRAKAYLASGKVDSAAQDLIAVIRADGNRASLFTTLARDLLGQKRDADVRALAKAVLDAHAGPSNGAMISAELYRMSGDETRARTIATEAIAKGPTAELYVLLASLERDPGRIAAVIKQALEVDPRSLPALSRLAAIQMATSKPSEALSTLDRIEAVTGPMLSWQMMRGEALARMGEKDRAKQSYSAARALARSSADFMNLCRSQGFDDFDLEQSLKDCESALDRDPDCNSCVKMISGVLMALGQHEKAVATYDKALARHPRDAEFIYGRGIARIKEGKDAEGEADIEAATRLDPKVAERFMILR